MATQKKKSERKDAGLSPSPAWQWEKGMLKTADILSSKKAEYLVLRWAQMVNASICEAKEEWLPRFGGSQSEEDRTAKEMLERYVSQAEEHMNKLFDMADEYSKKRCTSVGQQSDTVWHPKTERPKDESQILIDEGDGWGSITPTVTCWPLPPEASLLTGRTGTWTAGHISATLCRRKKRRTEYERNHHRHIPADG